MAVNADGKDKKLEVNTGRQELNAHKELEHGEFLVLPESATFLFYLCSIYSEHYSRAMQIIARTTREVCASIPTHQRRPAIAAC